MALLRLHTCLLFLALCLFNGNWVEREKKVFSLSLLLFSPLPYCTVLFLTLSFSFSSSCETLYFNCTCIYVLSFSSPFTIIIDLIEHADDKAKQIWHWNEVYGSQTNTTNTLNIDRSVIRSWLDITVSHIYLLVWFLLINKSV